MIHRARNVPVPPSLNPDPASGSPGAKEHAAVRSWFDSGRSDSLAPLPEFKAYKSPDVATTLEALFHRKCAYCESRYGPTQPVDIEHWRPKSRVNIHGQKTPREYGYEWLAMDWENLLPSCIDCNRQRRQWLPLADEDWQEIVVGKATQFPIRDENHRRKTPDETHDEQPLLLDPCTENPADYFSFDGFSGLLLPRTDIPLAQRQRAEASIHVYALNRRPLVHERLRHLRWLELELRIIRFLFAASGDPTLSGEMREVATALFTDTLGRLHERMATSEPYSAFLVQRLTPFLTQELGTRLPT